MRNAGDGRRVAVIMAGGSGERFWPVSRKDRPKQLLKLAGEQTMIAEAVERAAPLFGAENILVAANPLLAPAIREALPGVPPENVLAEPFKRNTAACLAFASAHAHRFGPPDKVTMAVLTADHAIGEPAAFRKTVERALALAESCDLLVTLGVRPTRPETGYGYIEAGEFVEDADHAAASRGRANRADDAKRARKVAHFIEKPRIDVAEEYAKSDKFFWNSGMFFWRVATLEAAFQSCLPGHAAALDAMRGALQKLPAAEAEKAVAAAFEPLESVSVDVGVMEKARNVAVLPAEFPWDDVGEWSALLRFGKPDELGNVVVGDAKLIDCEATIAYNACKRPQLLTAVGLRECVVVMTDDATMVAPLEQAQAVKKIVAALREAGREELL